MKSRDKIILAFLILIAFGYFIYLIKSILTPFVCSLIIAYLLDPFVDHLHEKWRISRLQATSLILGLFLVTLICLGVVVFPIVYTQFSDLISTIPEYLTAIFTKIYPQMASMLGEFGIKISPNFAELIENDKIATPLFDFLTNFLSNFFASSVALINILSLIFIMPILVFYLLNDWDVLVAKIHGYLPAKFAASTQRIAKEIDDTLSGYIRGQINVCLILGATYSVLLSFTGLNFGFLIGFLTGLFAFIPYIGALSGVTAAIIIALFQWGFDAINVSFVALVFVFGQILESNFLTPKLIGSRVGLHPVWIIFGLFVFGSLFGMIGILFATPLTAISGVLIRHLALEYKKRFAHDG
jgi:predicted PurR-regulated permease PerM